MGTPAAQADRRTADVLGKSSYDGLPATKVAERADVAIGSVYQFFPGKQFELAFRGVSEGPSAARRGAAADPGLSGASCGNSAAAPTAPAFSQGDPRLTDP
jgi:AcrR family transcriptional regulator